MHCGHVTFGGPGFWDIMDVTNLGYCCLKWKEICWCDKLMDDLCGRGKINDVNDGILLIVLVFQRVSFFGRMVGLREILCKCEEAFQGKI